MDALEILPGISIPLNEIELTATTAQGPGGQHVNRSSTAIQLRFNIHTSSLPIRVKARLFNRCRSRITRDGELILRAQQHRSQEQNRREALERLREFVAQAAEVRKSRRPTRPTGASRKKRLENKNRRGQTKSLRGKVTGDS